jgi:hypothetical protein
MVNVQDVHVQLFQLLINLDVFVLIIGIGIQVGLIVWDALEGKFQVRINSLAFEYFTISLFLFIF